MLGMTGEDSEGFLKSLLDRGSEEEFEEIDSFAIIKDRTSSQKNGGDSEPRRILFRGDEKKYFVAEPDEFIWNSFYEMWERERESQSGKSRYPNFIKGVLEKTDSVIDEMKIINLEESDGECAKFKLKNEEGMEVSYTAGKESYPVAMIYASLSGGDIQIEEELCQSVSELKSNEEFKMFDPEGYKLASIDQCKLKPENSEMDTGEYEELSFGGYCQGPVIKTEGQKSQNYQNQDSSSQKKKKQRFLALKKDNKNMYQPLNVPGDAEMLRKELRKRTDDSTVDPNELEKTNILNEFSLPAEIFEKSSEDLELYARFKDDTRKTFAVEDMTKGNGSQKKKITPSIPYRGFIEVDDEAFELPIGKVNSFVTNYVPRIKEKLKVKNDGPIEKEPRSASFMYR